MSRDPIVLVGAQRSGTTWMGRLLGERPEIAYWVEPRQVWSFGHWFRPDDRLTEEDATPFVKRHIRRRFQDYADRHGKPRFCEKTPNNCCRLPFVRAVLPEARILLIVRDGRSVIRSTVHMREQGPDWNRIGDRLRESSPWDWLAFASRAPWVLAKIRGKPVKYWGVRPPGWRSWVEHDPPLVAMSKAWAAAIRIAVEDGRAMSPDRFLEVRYEALTERPREVMQQIVDFLALPAAGDLIDKVVAQADPARQAKWRTEMTPEVQEAVRPHLEPTLRWLGYEW